MHAHSSARLLAIEDSSRVVYWTRARARKELFRVCYSAESLGGVRDRRYQRLSLEVSAGR